MNLCLVTEFFDPHCRQFSGGVEARTAFIYRQLKHKHRLTVIARSKNFIPTSFVSIFPRLKFILQATIGGLKLKPVDLFEGSNFIAYLPAFLAAKIRHKPAVAWYADVYQSLWFKHYSPLTALSGFILEAISLRLPWNQIIAMSQATKEKLIRAGIDPYKIKVIYGGVDVESIQQLKVKKYTRPTIITLARLVNYKHIDDLIRATAIVKEKIPQVHLRVLGEGPQRSELDHLSTSLNLARHVTFHGNLPHPQAMKLLKKSHLFSLPSTVEGFGLVTIEALAAGVPFVSSDIPPTREITQGGQGGLLFPPRDYHQLALGLLQLLTQPKLYRQKQAQAAKIVPLYSWEKIATQTETFYRTTLNSHR